MQLAQGTMFKRKIESYLETYLNSDEERILCVDGARQVGKTWVIKEFGINEYKNVAYINCDRIAEMKSLFF